MKTYLVFLKSGEVDRIEAVSMNDTHKAIRFFNGKKLVAIFNFSEVKKVGESKFFPELKKLETRSLSVETLNDWARELPRVETSVSSN